MYFSVVLITIMDWRLFKFEIIKMPSILAIQPNPYAIFNSIKVFQFPYNAIF